MPVTGWSLPHTAAAPAAAAGTLMLITHTLFGGTWPYEGVMVESLVIISLPLVAVDLCTVFKTFFHFFI